MRKALAILVALALACRPAQAANVTKGISGDMLVSPTTPPISFFWATYDDTIKAIPQCAGFQVFVAPNNGSAVKPTFPLSFTAMPENYPPVSTTLPGVGIGDQFAWSAAYPPGTRIGFAMTDAANNSGGYVGGYTFVPGSTNCTLVDQPSSLPVSFSASPLDQPCDEVIVDIQGGTSPYTLSVVAGTSGLYANVTGLTTRRVNLRNIVPAGQQFHLFVTDSDDQSSIVEPAMMSELGRTQRCFRATALGGDSSTPVGAIVGGVIGAVALAVLIALAAWFFVRRRRRQRAEQYRLQEQQTSEFRTADGSAPLVEPFRVPLGSVVGAPHVASPDSATYTGSSPGGDSYDKTLESAQAHEAQYLAPSPIAAHPHPQTPQHPYDPYANPYEQSYDPDPRRYAYEPPSTASYEPVSSGSTYVPHPSSLHQSQPSQRGVTDDLANPEEFEYRLPTDGSSPWAGALPPGARSYH
ncbi:hypothetical protein Rt10032_c16g5691 [Rhodotorula toruloides]|uniref:receptor protein-tyrosine kinase n=1 Tax=Rhodotorula toruloides TaxID=5286 RepID=A0A511KQ68_RHOTO|nr:hypothetical protein Rt10032_c16g5691 [Rhodotorula toruloides]